MKFVAIVGITAGVGVGNGLFCCCWSFITNIGFYWRSCCYSNRVCCFWYYTYTMSKQVPSEKLDSVDAEQKASTAASMVV